MGDGRRVAADAVQIDGTHPDAAIEQAEIERARGGHVLGGLRTSGGERQEFLPDLLGEDLQVLPDRLHTRQEVEPGTGTGSVLLRELGDGLGDHRATRLHALAVGRQLGLLLGEEGLQAEQRVHRA